MILAPSRAVISARRTINTPSISGLYTHTVTISTHNILVSNDFRTSVGATRAGLRRKLTHPARIRRNEAPSLCGKRRQPALGR